MKILRMTGMALVVILMSVHFVACNDDNDDDDPIGPKFKRIMQQE